MAMPNTAPTTLDDVIALVHRLYQPGPPDELTKIQDVLQGVQRSPDGWAIADSLLAVHDQHVQFFAALTFTVKLNSDWQSLSEDDVPGLRDRLVNWFVQLVSHGTSQLVAKKLCSTLVVFFLRFPDAWPDCIRHLACCLSGGRVVPREGCAGLPPSEQLVQGLDVGKKLALLWFAAILVEEVSKVDSQNIRNQHFHHKIYANADEVAGLLRNALDVQSQSIGALSADNSRVVDAGLKTFQSWVLYSLRAFIDANVKFDMLKPLTPMAMKWLADEEMFETASELITDILTHFFSFMTPEDNQCLADLLTSPWAVERYEQLMGGDTDWSSIQFSRLLVAFAEATVQKLVKSLDTHHGQMIMQMLHGILTIPGYPQVDEEISSTTFEFWGSLVEYLLDSQHTSERLDETWVDAGKKEVNRAVKELWRKTRMPGGQAVATWRKDQREGFMSFRKDAADFVESAYGLLGADLFSRLVDASLPHKGFAWEDVEASLFCLNALSDSLSDEPIEDAYLEKLFGSPLFVLLADLGRDIPIKARTTAVGLIGSYSPFFERRPDFLPSVLNFLFTCISTPSLARNASKSICSLCSSCRSTLTTELGTFLYQYELFAGNPSADDTAKERVLCAISFVVQALPSDDAKVPPITKLLAFVGRDAQECLLATQTSPDDAREIGLLALRCLASIGRGLQVPDDVPILLTDDGSTSTTPTSTASTQPPSFWEHGPGAALQQDIVNTVTTLVDALHNDGEAIDAACAVFRTGFAETSPGLFVFPPAVVTQFLLDRARTGTRIETVLSTASTLISSHSLDGGRDISAEARALLELVLGLVERMRELQTDPEVAQGVVEVLTRLLRRYVATIVRYQPQQRIERLFVFALEALAVRETLVKKAAAGFWTALLGVNELDEEVQAAVDGIVRACGPGLAEKLVWAIGGGCARSEVDSMTEPLRKLVARQVHSRRWLAEALAKADLDGANVEDKDKRIFLEKVISLRGKRGTNQVAKEFWLKCRGTEFAYAS